MNHFCTTPYPHHLSSDYSLFLWSSVFLYLPLIHMLVMVLHFSLFFWWILVSASLCSKEQSYSGNDGFPRSHLSTFLRLGLFVLFRRSENTKHGLHLTRCWVGLIFSRCHAVPDCFTARTMEGRMGQNSSI